MQFGEELPCGGYAEQDKLIKNNMKILSQSQNQIKNQLQNKLNKLNLHHQQKAKNCQQQKCQNCSCDNKKSQQQVKAFQQVKTQQQVKKQQQLKQKENRKITGSICKKCKQFPSALIHKNDPICKDCLLKNIEYKCRLTLQNTMKVKGTSSMLICFSGGLNSICLVNLLSSLKKRYQKHHLFGEVKCIHIQQQDTIPQGYSQMFEKEMGIPLEIINIRQIFEGQNKNIQDVRNIFKMFNRSANTLDLLNLFKDRLIINYAKKFKFQYVLKGINGQNIAGSVFKYFTKGIGGQITQLSSRQEDCLFHYPLRQHLQKELQYYFYSLKCNRISLKSQANDLSNFCSQDLDDHLNNFILNLQTMYSHTAPAITRTSQKIQSNRKNTDRCKWCMLKNSFGPNLLCRKCDRMLEAKNQSFDNEKLPNWLRIHH